MVNILEIHSALTNGRHSPTRPAGRRAERPSHLRPPVRPLDEVLRDLAQTRRHYENLRIGDGPLAERAHLVSALHALRAEASLARIARRS